MKKKLVGGLIILLLLMGLGTILLVSHSQSSAPETFAQAQAKAPAAKPACLTDNKALASVTRIRTVLKQLSLVILLMCQPVPMSRLTFQPTMDQQPVEQ